MPKCPKCGHKFKLETFEELLEQIRRFTPKRTIRSYSSAGTWESQSLKGVKHENRRNSQAV